MSELIVLCAGSASDRKSDACDPRQFDALFEPAAIVAKLRSGGLARALARAATAADGQDDSLLPRELPHERWLRARCALDGRDSVEAWSAASCSIPPPAWRLTPVNIRVGQDQLTLADPASLALAERHWRALADAAAPAFRHAGFALEAADGERWFARGDRVPDWRARSWTMASGRSVDAYLPEGGDAREWRRILTEVQMTWHEHPANREREAAGLAPVNALWLDGLCTGACRPLASVAFTNDSAIAGLARGGGAAAHALPGFAPDATTLAEAARAGDVLVDVDAWRAARRAGDAAAWRAAWDAFDAWLGGLAPHGTPPAGFAAMRAVFTGERRALELRLPGAPRWRFWRRTNALAAVLAPDGGSR